MTAHAYIVLDEASCTSCMICVRECPTWCITIESHTEQVAGAGRTKAVKRLDDFTIDWGLCMFCGICVEVCPFDALEWSAAADFSAGLVSELRHGKVRLAQAPTH